MESHANPSVNMTEEELVAMLADLNLETTKKEDEGVFLENADAEVNSLIAKTLETEVIDRSDEDDVPVDANELSKPEMLTAKPDTDVNVIQSEQSEQKVEAETAEAVKAEPAKTKTQAKRVRQYYANAFDRMKGHIGEHFDRYLILETRDASHSQEAGEQKKKEFVEAFGKAGKKVQNRAAFFIEFSAGKATSLNYVCETAVKMLCQAGKITLGANGNLYQKLLSKPYSPRSASAMGTNTVNAMKLLKMVTTERDGSLVPNENSTHLKCIRINLGV